jgi:hypothetical protein
VKAAEVVDDLLLDDDVDRRCPKVKDPQRRRYNQTTPVETVAFWVCW